MLSLNWPLNCFFCLFAVNGWQAYYGHREALDFLLKFFPNTEVKDKQGRTPLDLAAARGESSCVECLMYNKASCESRDSVSGRTPVHAAAANNQEEALKVMVLVANSQMDSARAAHKESAHSSFYNLKLANLKDNAGRTPLMLATEQGHLNTALLLVSQMGANVLAADHSGRTALHRAVSIASSFLTLISLFSL